MSTQHTPGPWRWEINRDSKILHLVGGVPRFDLTVMDFSRWGMTRAVPRFRDTSLDGMNLMDRLCDKPEWIADFPGRSHHANWCADVIHPDARLMAAAPILYAALEKIAAVNEFNTSSMGWVVGLAKTAIEKATGVAHDA